MIDFDRIINQDFEKEWKFNFEDKQLKDKWITIKLLPYDKRKKMFTMKNRTIEFDYDTKGNIIHEKTVFQENFDNVEMEKSNLLFEYGINFVKHNFKNANGELEKFDIQDIYKLGEMFPEEIARLEYTIMKKNGLIQDKKK